MDGWVAVLWRNLSICKMGQKSVDGGTDGTGGWRERGCWWWLVSMEGRIRWFDKQFGPGSMRQGINWRCVPRGSLQQKDGQGIKGGHERVLETERESGAVLSEAMKWTS